MREQSLSLQESHPNVAKGWHPEKNEGLTPLDVTARSRRRVWWRCLRDPNHEWIQNVYRQLSHKCAFCEMEGKNLLLLRPELAEQWHESKNKFGPATVSCGSKKRIWWQCPRSESHVWDATVQSRAKFDRGCPFCSGRRVDEHNSLATGFPDIAKEWHPIKNGDLTSEQVVCGSGKKVWWLCGANKEHEWRATIYARCRAQTGCPFCARVNDNNNLAKQFPEIAKEWHPTKNGHLFPSWDPKSLKKLADNHRKNRRLRPSDFAAFSNQYAWWQCSTSKEHVWRAIISNRTHGNHGCPFCAGLKVAPDNSLAAKNKGLAKLWHPTRNLPLTPEQVTPGSDKLVWWRCFKSPLHIWQQQVGIVSRSYKRKNSGCPFCTGQKAGRDNNLAARYPAVAALWHLTRNFPLTPEEVTPGSSRVVWWQCPKSVLHSWRAPIKNVVAGRNSKTHGCGFCSGLRIAKDESLAVTHPQLLPYWDRARNLNLTPKQVGHRSHKLIYWRCTKSDKHLWKLPVRAMVKRTKYCLLCTDEA